MTDAPRRWCWRRLARTRTPSSRQSRWIFFRLTAKPLSPEHGVRPPVAPADGYRQTGAAACANPGQHPARLADDAGWCRPVIWHVRRCERPRRCCRMVTTRRRRREGAHQFPFAISRSASISSSLSATVRLSRAIRSMHMPLHWRRCQATSPAIPKVSTDGLRRSGHCG